MGIPLRLLIVEDVEDDALLIARTMRRSGYAPDFERVDTAAAMEESLDRQDWDIIIADYSMPSFSGMAALRLVKERGLDLPFILVSGTIGEDSAVEAMRAGAHDYVLKNNLARLGPAVHRELHEAAERSARRRAEDLQKKSEARFRRMADNIQDGLTIIEDGRVVYVNDRACEITGYSKDEYSEMTLLDLVVPEEWERVRQLIPDAATEEGGPRRVEMWILRKDGARRCIQSRYSPSREGDRIAGHYVTTTDITERKLAEREVEERRRYLERVLAAAPDAIVTLDAEHQVVEWNSGAERIFGYSSQETAGQPIDRLINQPDTLDGAVALTKIVMGGLDVPPREVVRYRKDGTPVDVIAAGSPILVDGSVLGAVAIYTDISERKRAERLLRALNEASLAVERAMTPQEIFGTVGREFEKIGFSCAIFTTDDSRSLLFPKYYSYSSKAVRLAETLLGVEAGEFSISIESVHVFRQAVWEGQTVFVEDKEVVAQVMPSPLKRFARRIVDVLNVSKSICVPLIVEEECIGLLSVQSEDLSQDDIPAITAFAHQMAAAWQKTQLVQDLAQSLEELTRTQAQFLQAQKMEAIGRLAGGVAHDFNNALTIIHLSTQLLKRQLRPQDPLWEYVSQIDQAGERAGALTKQLLSFSRRELVEPQVVNLSQVVGDMTQMLRRIIGEDIDLETSLPDDLWPVYLEPAQVDQMIINLAVNARDAMPDGGTLSVELSNVVLDETYTAQHVDVESGEYARLVVGDTGVGMDKAIQARLFEPFFTTKEPGKGTGLGLATVYGFVKGSGGHIWVTSEVARGTTFEIYFPRTERTESEPKSRAMPARTVRGTETILVVEDDPAVRKMALKILTAHGYQVLTAGNGPEALQLGREFQEPIHLLLTDVVLPQMNGREVAQQLEALRPGLKVVFMSGYSGDVIAHHGVLDEGIVFLPKPFTMEGLTDKVRSVLDAGHQVPAGV